MSLGLSVQRARDLLNEKPEAKDGLWSYNACKLSQEIIEDVLERCPSHEYVKNVILDEILRKFVEDVRKVEEQNRGGSWTKYLTGFRKNIESRCSSLEKYVQLVTV